MDYSGYTDKDIYDLFHKAELADRLANDSNWDLLKEAAERIVERTVDDLANNIKADNIIAVMEAQMIIRKYKYGLFNEVEILKEEVEFAFSEVKERGLLSREEAG